MMDNKRRRVTSSGNDEHSSFSRPNVTTTHCGADEWLAKTVITSIEHNSDNDSIISSISNDGSYRNDDLSPRINGGYMIACDNNGINEIIINKFLFPEDYEPRNVDVLIGRGKRIFNHIGNKRLRSTVNTYLEAYASAKTNKQIKSNIINSIINQVRHKDKGNFLKQDKSNNGRWFDVGDFVAKEKISQIFRDEMRYAIRNKKNQIKIKEYEKIDKCTNIITNPSNNKKRKIQLMKNARKTLNFKQKQILDRIGGNQKNKRHQEPCIIAGTSIHEQRLITSYRILKEFINQNLQYQILKMNSLSSTYNSKKQSSIDHPTAEKNIDTNRITSIKNHRTLKEKQQIMRTLLLKKLELAEAERLVFGKEQNIRSTQLSPFIIAASSLSKPFNSSLIPTVLKTTE